MTENRNPQNLPARYANGQFGPGNPGKPKGATDRSSRRAARAFLEDFEANRDEFLRDLREQFPVEYARTITRILPRDIEPEAMIPVEEWTPEDLAQAHAAARRLFSVETDPRAVMAGLQAILWVPRTSEA